MSVQVFDAEKYLTAQSGSYEIALKEICNGKKQSHWIWYIFPQLVGLGRSSTSKFYAIQNLEEAKAYLQNDLLKQRLIEISEALLKQDGKIRDIMGSPDDMKVCSCMTLFQMADPSISIFQKVLDKFYNGKPDRKTMQMLSGISQSVGNKPSRWQMIEVFQDTQQFYTENKKLADALEKSKDATKFYDKNDYPEISVSNDRAGEIIVTKNRTFEAAIKLHNTFHNKKICVLNFASATNPGGGVKHGARAQEESLCRCSTLYPTLDRRFLWEKYYDVNRAAHDCLHTDACIYSPEIIICKTDESYPQRMKEEDWVTVDVITCAAPNLRYEPSNLYNPGDGETVSLNSDVLYQLHIKRAEHILTAAIDNKVDILVLGAFGCGAFRNDPYVVAKAYKDVLKTFRGYFDRIEFAVFTAETEYSNYIAFLEEFKYE